MIRRPPRSTRTDTRLPDRTLVRSTAQVGGTDANHLRARIDESEQRVVETDGARPALSARLATVGVDLARSEEHTSELQSLMRISYAAFCSKHKLTSSLDDLFQ